MKLDAQQVGSVFVNIIVTKIFARKPVVNVEMGRGDEISSVVRGGAGVR